MISPLYSVLDWVVHILQMIKQYGSAVDLSVAQNCVQEGAGLLSTSCSFHETACSVPCFAKLVRYSHYIYF